MTYYEKGYLDGLNAAKIMDLFNKKFEQIDKAYKIGQNERHDKMKNITLVQLKIVKAPKQFNSNYIKSMHIGQRIRSKFRMYTKISENEFLSQSIKHFC